MTIEDFVIALLRLDYYESYPDDYEREINEYRKLVDFYIQNNLTKKREDNIGGHDLYIHGDRN